MKLKELRDKKILILGFGKEGKATLKFLQQKLPEANADYTDKTFRPNYLSLQNKYDIVIKTPGIPKHLVTVPYTTATNIFFAEVRGITIGVTGSKGKSTTASLIHHILKTAGKKSHLVGNIGNPMLEELMLSNEKNDIFVCELSSYQLDDIKFSPHISIALNLFPEHMDYHESILSYYQAKQNIIKYANHEDFFIYNPDDRQLLKWAKETDATSLPFTNDQPVAKEEIPLLGNHNIMNVRAAVTAARLLKVAEENIKSAVRSFTPLPHRLENVGTFSGITFYDDAISTTPESTIAALSAIFQIGTLFLGGQDRGYDFGELVKVIATLKIPNLVAFPDSGKTIIETLHAETSWKPNILETSSMKEAVAFAYKNTPKGTICLLSTASPSYSLWKNFEEKGNQFQKYVTSHI